MVVLAMPDDNLAFCRLLFRASSSGSHQMRALRLCDGQVKFDSAYREPVPVDAESLVRVARAGICETDLQLVKGYMGFSGVLGHEFVGIAETGPMAGERVVGEINCGCGQCRFCDAGMGNHCPSRSVLGILGRDGAFADWISLPHKNLHRVPDSVPDELAVFAEPLAAAYRIPEQLPFIAGTKAIVLGDGRLGNLCAQVLAERRLDVLCIGKHAEKLKLLTNCNIATKELAEVEELLARGQAPSAALVVEATGSASGLAMAMRLAEPRGTIVLKTTVAGEQQLAMAPTVIDELTIVGSRCGPFQPALQALAEERIDVRPLISAVRPFEEAIEAFKEAARPGVLKVQLDLTLSPGSDAA